MQVHDKIKKKENIDWISASTYFLGLLYLDYVDAPGCNVPWGEPRVAFWTDEEAKPLKQVDKGSGLYAVYGSCKICADAHITNAEAPKKVGITKSTAR
uniref:Uncharacterized protein n=1 Tax=Oryza punctata TaxID=4537 RepID=A0A0E0KAX9_ORYPU